MTYTRKAAITCELAKLIPEETRYIKVTHPMFDADLPALAKSADGKVPILPIIDLESGLEQWLIPPTVLVSVLQRQDGGYVGRCYEVTSHAPREGKNYFTVTVYEIDDPEGDSDGTS